MARTFETLKAEVADLEARKGSLDKYDRARLPFARMELAATPEQQEILKAGQAAHSAALRELMTEARRVFG